MKYRFGNIVFWVLVCLTANVFAQTNIPDGHHRTYFPSGRVSSEGMIRNGQPDGYWKTYWPTGILRSEGNRVNSLLDSTWVFYTVTGDTAEIINYRLGRRSGYTYRFETSVERNQVSRHFLASRELFIDDRREGQSYYFFPNGNIRQTTNFRNGRRQGISKEFDENGTVITIFEYHNDHMIGRQSVNRLNAQGERVGTWKTFHPDGNLKEEKYYRNGLLHGVSRMLSERGIVINERVYREGQLVEEGIQMRVEPIALTSYHEDGVTIRKSGLYLDSIPIGVHIFFNRDGIPERAIHYNSHGVRIAEGPIDENENRTGEWKTYFETGELRASGRRVSDRQHGEWTFYSQDGSRFQVGNFNNGVMEGKWTWFFPSGNIFREEYMARGVPNGLSIQYSDSATIVTQGEFLDGEREGFWIEHVGDIREEGSYIMGLRDGVWRAYHRDGQLFHTGSFIQGIPDGRHLFYFPDGTLKEEQNYVMGRRHRNWRKFYENGALFLTVTYNNDVEIRINGVRVDNIR